MKKRTVIGALGVIKKGNKFLMAFRHEPGFPKIHHKWEFPGGEIEFEEKPEQAVVREVKEEVGVEVEVIYLLPYVVTHFWKIKKETIKVILLSYLCKIIKGEPNPANKEVEKIKWFSLNEIKPNECLPSAKEVLESVLKLEM